MALRLAQASLLIDLLRLGLGTWLALSNALLKGGNTSNKEFAVGQAKAPVMNHEHNMLL